MADFFGRNTDKYEGAVTPAQGAAAWKAADEYAFEQNRLAHPAYDSTGAIKGPGYFARGAANKIAAQKKADEAQPRPPIPSAIPVVTQQPEAPQAQMDYPRRAHQESWVGDYGSGMTKTVDDAGKTSYTGVGQGGEGKPFSYVDQLQKLQAIDPERYAGGRQGYFDNPAMNEPAGGGVPQINYEGGWNDYFKSIAPATAANKSRRIAQEQAGQERLGAQRERGALSRVEREGELRRQAAGEEREYGIPEREARDGEARARTALLGQQTQIATMSAREAKRNEVAQDIVNSPDKYGGEGSPQYMQAKAWLERKHKEALELRGEAARVKAEAEAAMFDGKKDGGLIKGYADGGAIGRAQTQQLNPLVSQYGQYLQAAAQTGVAPVPFTQYINLLGSTRGAMNQTPTQFADGGDVSALNRPLEGPGTGRSDSIPAVIDGEQPAALSRGEFVIPEHIVRKKGTEFFEKLIAQYSEGVPANG